MTKTIHYEETDSFQKDFKKLKNRFKTLDEDFEVAKKNTIELFHVLGIDNQGVTLIPKITNKELQIYKMRKFACKSLKGRGVQSGIRIIYAYCLKSKKVTFVEIYFKADQENEDKHKIATFLKQYH